MSRASFFIPLAVFCLIMLVGYIGFGLEDRHQLPSALLGKPFPEFSAPLLYEPERLVAKADLIGQPTLVNVWATWCPTCKAEHAELMKIAATTQVRLVGINYKDDSGKAIRWLVDYGDPYEFVIVDTDGALGVELGVYGAPETFLLDAQGNIVYKRVGDVNPRIWRDELAPRLAEMGVYRMPAAEENFDTESATLPPLGNPHSS
jgi:cytochrome c biogenesis protein CcmG/thiol:disulfide interchange protein DsbE